MKRAWLSSLFLVAVSLLVSNFASAQTTASILGRIEDASGAAVPDANVTVTSLETGAVHTGVSDASGGFRILQLPVGRYEVKAEKPGFKAAVQTGLNLVVGQVGAVNLKLEVGEVQQQVTVTGEAPVVNTTTASVAGLVGEKEVKELPLNGRSFDQLILLNAGTVNYTSLKVTTGSGTPQGNRFTVAGRRPSENYFLLNGVELTGPNQDQTIPWGVSGQLLGVDAIREFNVVTDAYGAEYGKKAGAQVSVVTQSGTNQFHGTVFEFLRNSVLDARNFFDVGNAPLPTSVPPFKRNQFGGSAGGPIVKDKTFIFGNYEGLRYRLGQSINVFVPDNNARAGLLPCEISGPSATPNQCSALGVAAGTPVKVSGLQDGMLPYVKAYWPAPNGPPIGGGTANFFGNPLEQIREEYGVVRVDHTLSAKDTFSGNYTIDDGFHVSPVPDILFTNDIGLRYQVLSLQETHVFSPTTINVFTVGFSHVGMDFFPIADASFDPSLSLTKGKAPGLITVGVGAGGGGGSGALVSAGASTGSFFVDRKSLFTYADQVQIVKGKHQLSLGTWFQRQRDNGAGNSNDLGRADFGSLTAMLQGTVGTLRAVPNEITHQWREWVGAWYAQDAIALRPNLNLRIGLRHEFTNGWNDPSGRAANFVYQNGVVQLNPQVGTSALTENNAKWLFSPRIGIAWDPRGNGKTSIRAAFGTYYDIQDDFTTILLGTPPFNNTLTFNNQPFLSNIPVIPGAVQLPTCGAPGAPLAPPGCAQITPRGFMPNFKTPTAEEWNLTIEQQITKDTSFRISYVGSEGFHGVVIADPNTIAPLVCANAAGCVSGGVNPATARGLAPQGTLYVPVGTRPNPVMAAGTYYFNFEGTTSYNGLQTEIKKRFSAGLQFKGNYTWSKNLDEGSGEGLGQGQNTTNIMTPYNIRFNKGPSAHDFTHQASISGSYELPMGQGKRWMNSTGTADKVIGGWQFNWIVSLTSGYPIIPTLGANVSGNGDATSPDRPNFNPNVAGGVITGTATQWFNPAAFSIPQSGTWGNMGVGVIRGPGTSQVDMSLFKNTSLSERVKLQFRAEFFNILNHTNLGFPNSALYSGNQFTATPTQNPSAGRITFTTTSSRQIQFGLKLSF